jgi:fructokinase
VCDLNLRAPFNSAEIIRWSIAHADILKVSDEELPEVARLLGEPTIASGFPHNATDELRRTDVANWAASRLLELAPQCRLVAITLGPHGSFLADRCNGHRHTGVPVRVVDTVGAGDAFTAGLVHAHLRGGSLSQMSEVANLCGSYVAGQPGATPRLSPALAASIRVALS